MKNFVRTEMEDILKPQKQTFVTYRFIIRSLVMFSILGILQIIASKLLALPATYFWTVFLLWEVFDYYSLTIQYRKEEYHLFSDKIIAKGGGIFSDRELELVIGNVTHVNMRLPFIQYNLLGTGTIHIESAGMASTEIRLRAIEQTHELYETIEEKLQKNGFSLQKKELLHEETPSGVGVFFETLRGFGINVFVTFYVYVAYLLEFFSQQNQIIEIAFFVGVLLAIGLLIRSIFVFLDLKKRTYQVYDDAIVYEEGFLSKNYAFIPVENISDSTLNQTFVDKLFDLYDVTVSCQGVRQEIKFKNMAHGPELKGRIDEIASKAESLIGKQKKKVAKKEAKKEIPLKKDTKFTAEYSMHWGKTLFPWIILLIALFLFTPDIVPGTMKASIILGLIFASIATIIRISATRFYVNEQSVQSVYNFLTQKDVEFTTDKITGIIFSESFVDKWFGTCSVQFWSIGSSALLQFSNIKRTDELYEEIVSKIGITPQKEQYSISSAFSFSEMLRANIFITFVAVLALLASGMGMLASGLLVWRIIFWSIVGLYVLLTLYRIWYYNKSHMRHYQKYVTFEKGIFWKTKFYVAYDDIKDITTIKYPFSARGKIRFNVAGEVMVQEGKRTTAASNQFVIRYVEDISVKDELIDYILLNRPKGKEILDAEQNIEKHIEEAYMVVKEDLGNSLLGLFGVSLIIFPLLVLLPITIPIVIWAVKVKSYRIEPTRVVARWGIVYRKQTSIIYPKIDNISFTQGMINKLFRNGNITVNTTGGSTIPELVIKNIEPYKAFYDELKKHY